MLSRKHRINKKTIQSLKKPAKKIHQGAVILMHFPANMVWKVNIVVSKKISKKAVSRNRIRRSLYGVARLSMPTIPSGYYIVHVQKSAKEKSLKEIRSDLETAFVDMSQTR